MKKVIVTVSQAEDGSFWCHTEEDVFDSGLNGAGATVAEAKEDLMMCLEESKKDAQATEATSSPSSLCINTTCSRSSSISRS